LPEGKTARVWKKCSGEKNTHEKSTSQKKGKEEKVARKQFEKRRSVLLSRYRFIFLHDRGKGEKKEEKIKNEKKKEKRAGLKTGHYNCSWERHSCEI